MRRRLPRRDVPTQRGLGVLEAEVATRPLATAQHAREGVDSVRRTASKVDRDRPDRLINNHRKSARRPLRTTKNNGASGHSETRTRARGPQRFSQGVEPQDCRKVRRGTGSSGGTGQDSKVATRGRATEGCGQTAARLRRGPDAKVALRTPAGVYRQSVVKRRRCPFEKGQKRRPWSFRSP